jgi:hypothetical protein
MREATQTKITKLRRSLNLKEEKEKETTEETNK